MSAAENGTHLILVVANETVVSPALVELLEQRAADSRSASSSSRR